MEKREFVPSEMQGNFFDWVKYGRGSAALIAVAGSGKSTTIVRSLPFINENNSVQVLAFNAPVAAEMREKIKTLGEEIGRAFRGVRASTFHSLGYGALHKHMNLPRDHETDGKKLKRLFRKHRPDDIELYGDFVCKLVDFAKGEGFGCLSPEQPSDWMRLIDHHALRLDSEEADEETAIALARGLLRLSNRVAKEEGWIDYNDQLYLPVLWDLRLWQNDWVFIDEAQDTNPVRREIARKALRRGGRLVAVGDPNQAIYGFTGASHDAIDLIKRDFDAVELPLTVSYRCPKAAEAMVQHIVPHFTVHPGAKAGDVLHLPVRDGVARLGSHDAVICRNTAPLVDLAFKLMAQGRGCVLLGKDIGEGLVNLIKAQRAKGIDGLVAKMDARLAKECEKLVAKDQEEKAESLRDRHACIMTVVGSLQGADRTIPKLIAKIEAMFSDSNGVLTLCTGHKAKGKEWDRVAILRADLMPSKFARQEHQYQQELNLIYVANTRFMSELIFLEGEDA